MLFVNECYDDVEVGIPPFIPAGLCVHIHG